MDGDWRDQVAIVTGAGQGVGEAIARRLAAAGARVLVNDFNPDRAARVAAAIVADGGAAHDEAADVSNKFQAVQVVEAARAAWGRLDILVNALEVVSRGPLLKLDEWNWNRDLEINLKSVFLMTQLAGRVMSWENGARGGVILNFGPAAAAPTAEYAAYHAAKAGVASLTAGAAQELAPFGVRVYSLTPEQTPPEVVAAWAVRLCAADAPFSTGALLSLADLEAWG